MPAFVIGIASVTKTILIKRPGREEESFTAEIRVRDMDEQDLLQEKLASGEITGVDHIKDDILCLGGFADSDGKEMEVTEDIKSELLQNPFVWMGLVRAWNEVQRGLPESTEKN